MTVGCHPKAIVQSDAPKMLRLLDSAARDQEVGGSSPSKRAAPSVCT